MPEAPRFHSTNGEQFHDLAELFKTHGGRSISSVHLHHTFVPDIALFRSVARDLASEEAAGLELCQRMWRFHTQELGWSDIAQHVTIDPAGRIWLNRSWDRPPASAKGFNGSSKLGPFMIEMIGNFDHGFERPTDPQWHAVLTVTASIQKAFELPAEAVAFHNEMTELKSCPGTSLEKPKTIKEIAAQHAAAGGGGGSRSGARRSTAPMGVRQTAAFALLTDLLDRDPLASTSGRGVAPVGDPGEELPEDQIAVDAVARLTTRTGTSRGLGRGGGNGFELTGPMLQKLKPHVINLRQGLFSSDGDFTTTEDEAEALVRRHLAGWVAERLAADETPRVMIHAHGGLNSEEVGLAYASTMYRWWLKMGVYPIFFVWETGTIETFWQLLEERLRERERALLDVVSDARDFAVELIVQELGQDFWTTMKLAAERAADDGPTNGSHQLARLLGDLNKKHDSKIEFHVVGHSAGAILHSYFMRECHKGTRTLPVKSLQYLAPACTIRLFKDLVRPLIDGERIETFTLYAMDSRTERSDPTVPAYGKSLLYLVSRGFERERGEPILGLQESVRGDPDLMRFLGLGASEPGRTNVVWSPTGEDVPDRLRAMSTMHGDFDNDPATMTSVALRILGLSSATGLPEVPAPTRRAVTDGRLFAPLASRIPEAPPFGAPASPLTPLASSAAVGVAALPLPAGGRRHALCIGINEYPGTARLNGCVADARLWAATLERFGFTTELMLDQKATHSGLMGQMRSAMASLRPGDHLVIVYAGHGAYFPDESGDEEDTRDEALVPVDYQQTDLFISDDELWDVLQARPEGAGVTAIMDCCHSMSNSRATFRFGAAPGNINIREIKPDRRQIEAHRTRTARVRSGQLKPIEAMRHIKFAACRDNEYALEVDGQGNFTRAAISVLNRTRRSTTNDQMRLEIEKAFRDDERQHPGLECRTADRETGFLGGFSI